MLAGGSIRGHPLPIASIIHFSVSYRRLGHMGSTTRRPWMDSSVISTILLVIILQGWRRRPPSLASGRLYSISRIDFAARLRFLNMVARPSLLGELGRSGWHGTSGMTRLTTSDGMNRSSKLTGLMMPPWADILTMGNWQNRDIRTIPMSGEGYGSVLYFVSDNSQDGTLRLDTHHGGTNWPY